MNNTIRTSVTLAALISAAALASAQAGYCPQQGAYYGGRGYNAWQWRGHAHAKQWRHTGWRTRTGQPQGQNASANEQANAGQSTGSAAQAQDQNFNANKQATAGQGQAAAQGLTQDQADKIRDALANSNSARVDQANFGLNVGASVPRDERLEPLPSQVVNIDPRLTGDKFLIVQDDIVIVDPRTNRVVALIPETGGTNPANDGQSGASQPADASDPNGSSASSNSAR